MFSKDNRHYRPVPRTIQQAFGPHHSFTPYAKRRTRADIICAALGVLGLGVVYALEWVWGWV
jgi:hypothetical protein